MAPKVKRYAGSRELREWALTLTDEERKRMGLEGIEISNRGRFHSQLVSAFNREHAGDGVRYVPISRDVPRTDDAFEDADKGDDERPTTYRQPRREKAEAAPQPMPALAFPGAPEQVMELLRSGSAQVIVVYVPLPMQVAAA